MERVSKQILVWRHDLKIRKGKIASQMAHAAVGSLINAATGKERASLPFTVDPKEKTPLHDWITQRFTKISVYVENEKELLELFQKAKAKGLPCALITDAGLTEFKGVPTRTCIGIGPCWAEEVDPLTGNLPLL